MGVTLHPSEDHVHTFAREKKLWIHEVLFTGDDEEKDNRPGRMVSALVDSIDMFLLQGRVCLKLVFHYGYK